jgi:hypothetical protein
VVVIIFSFGRKTEYLPFIDVFSSHVGNILQKLRKQFFENSGT